LGPASTPEFELIRAYFDSSACARQDNVRPGAIEPIMTRPRRAIGIDIGGTKMAVAAVNEEGQIVARETLATEAEQGFPRAVNRLIQTIQRLLAVVNWREGDVCGVGIGCAGPVDPLRGLINNPYTLAGWDQCDLVRPLQRRFGVPVYLENDADVAALGECVAGAGRGFDPVVMLTFGTGIGGAVVIRGEVYRGVEGAHPELGHVAVARRGPKCYCGIRGCLEAVASGTAIGDAGRAAGIGDARQVFAAARAGQAAARSIVRQARDATAQAAGAILHTFLPQRLVLGGGMMEDQYDLFAAAIERTIALATMAPRGRVSVARAQLGNDAGLVGAASVVFARMSGAGPGRP
jgi:glucokinase